eukprot:TRINITY_DN6745_c0_g1_i1.p1 TRINITY_DN6745_c0_g1~~TRINITY_DN6745_c0_g1_i1.p1  ORF type:complete len:407 (-),score=121.81 TRINITY_DN6745_c0_g1_i1:166-1386(-)
MADITEAKKELAVLQKQYQETHAALETKPKLVIALTQHIQQIQNFIKEEHTRRDLLQQRKVKLAEEVEQVPKELQARFDTIIADLENKIGSELSASEQAIKDARMKARRGTRAKPSQPTPKDATNEADSAAPSGEGEGTATAADGAAADAEGKPADAAAGADDAAAAGDTSGGGTDANADDGSDGGDDDEGDNEAETTTSEGALTAQLQMHREKNQQAVRAAELEHAMARLRLDRQRQTTGVLALQVQDVKKRLQEARARDERMRRDMKAFLTAVKAAEEAVGRTENARTMTAARLAEVKAVRKAVDEQLRKAEADAARAATLEVDCKELQALKKKGRTAAELAAVREAQVLRGMLHPMEAQVAEVAAALKAGGIPAAEVDAIAQPAVAEAQAAAKPVVLTKWAKS